MKSTINFFAPNSTEYRIFICSGEGKDRRESGAYTHLANSYLNAAEIFGSHSNVCSFSGRYGSTWKLAGKRKGNPKNHNYVVDEVGNKLLIIKG